VCSSDLKKLLFTAMALSLPLVLVAVVGGVGEVLAASSSSAKAMNINIVSIGGWNVWFFIAFWMLSQCILVHHARRGSKQQG
ncbi:MAG: hypothetical protein VB861_02765, partial [Planctomycetaceae bacterium]